MQHLHDASDESSPAACAREVLACVPSVMQHLRSLSQRRRARSLSVQQFRALGIIRHRGGMSLSELAEQLGLAVASASRLVDGLVRRGFLARTPIPENRRQLRLSLRPAGEAILAETLAFTHRSLAERLSSLSPAERQNVVVALRRLGAIFTAPATIEALPPVPQAKRTAVRRVARPRS